MLIKVKGKISKTYSVPVDGKDKKSFLKAKKRLAKFISNGEIGDDEILIMETKETIKTTPAHRVKWETSDVPQET